MEWTSASPMPRVAFALLAAFAIAACSDAAPGAPGIGRSSAANPTAEPTTPAPADRNTAAALQAPRPEAAVAERFRKGMAYSEFRALALTYGWRPAKDPACKVNLAGSNHIQLCRENPALGACGICDELEELSSCSSDGYCIVKFHDDGRAQVLEAVTYGDISDWKSSGDEAGLTLDSWSISR